MEVEVEVEVEVEKVEGTVVAQSDVFAHVHKTRRETVDK